MADKKLVIRQVKSPNGSSRKQRESLRAVGLGRIGKSSERVDSPILRGQLRKIDHLVEVSDG